MYIGLNFENIVTIGIILLGWMLFLHMLGQFGVRIASWLPGGG